MLTYNTNHPDMTLMPYIIYDTSESDSDFLPHRKPAPGAKGKKIFDAGQNRLHPWRHGMLLYRAVSLGVPVSILYPGITGKSGTLSDFVFNHKDLGCNQ